jgi:hypothetical protein
MLQDDMLAAARACLPVNVIDIATCAELVMSFDSCQVA